VFERYVAAAVLWGWLHNAGLTETTGVRMKGSPTNIGKMLVQYVNFNKLPDPPG